MRTGLVERRTTLLLVRIRFHIHTPGKKGSDPQPLLAEDCQVFAFKGSPANAQWIADEAYIKDLLRAKPDGNITRDESRNFLDNVLAQFEQSLRPQLNQLALQRAEALREAHRRVRRSASISLRVRVEPQFPLDVLGMYIYLPPLKA